MHSRVAVALFVLCCACGRRGDGNSGFIDCAWLMDESTCWKTTLGEYQQCLPQPGATGTLDSALTTCTYPDGTLVRFDEPLELPLSLNSKLNFRVLGASGGECVRAEYDGSRLSLANATGVLLHERMVLEATDQEMLQITCPNGQSQSAQDIESLFECAGDAGETSLFSSLPLPVFNSVGSRSGSMELSNGPGGSGVVLFTCSRP